MLRWLKEKLLNLLLRILSFLNYVELMGLNANPNIKIAKSALITATTRINCDNSNKIEI
jgi:hypothetical protein